MPRWSATFQERLEAGIDRTGDCHVWTKGCNQYGYGVIYDGKRKVLVHRTVYEREVGQIPPGLSLLHRCDNPPCCNSSHLVPGSQADNMADCKAKHRNNVGAKNGNAQLDDDKVRAIRAAQGTHREIAKTYGVTTSNISYIKGGKTWSHVK